MLQALAQTADLGKYTFATPEPDLLQLTKNNYAKYFIRGYCLSKLLQRS